LSLEGRGGKGKERGRQRKEEGEKREKGAKGMHPILRGDRRPCTAIYTVFQKRSLFYFAVDFTDINRFS